MLIIEPGVFEDERMLITGAKGQLGRELAEQAQSEACSGQAPGLLALDCSRINKHFGISPRPWTAGLEITIRQLWTGRQRL